jgi:hypothetical protein
MTIQYLSNDQDSDVKSYFPWSSASSSSLQGAVATKQQQNESPALSQTSDNNNSLELNNLEIQKNSNFMYNCSELEKIGNSTSSTSSDSNNTNTNTYNQAYDAAHKVNQVEEFEQEEEEEGDFEGDEHSYVDDDDEEDEIIDKTKINQLKIVNLENDLDSEAATSSN